MTEDRRGQLAVLLFDAFISLRRREIRDLNDYNIEYKKIIKIVCPEKPVDKITSCDIFGHLIEHRNPEATIIEILKQLKED